MPTAANRNLHGAGTPCRAIAPVRRFRHHLVSTHTSTGVIVRPSPRPRTPGTEKRPAGNSTMSPSPLVSEPEAWLRRQRRPSGASTRRPHGRYAPDRPAILDRCQRRELQNRKNPNQAQGAGSMVWWRCWDPKSVTGRATAHSQRIPNARYHILVTQHPYIYAVYRQA